MPLDMHGANVQHQRIREIILDRIISKEFTPGEKIPSERELCEIFSVSRTTVRRALDDLVAEGVLFRIPAKGTYVAASSLTINRNTGNIAFIRCYRRSPLSSINDDIFYPRILTGVETTISKNGYHCLVQSINENDYSDQVVSQLTQKVDGIICCELRNQRFLERLRATQLPLVLVSPSVIHNNVDIVEISNKQGAIDAVTHLIELGHRHIAFVGGSPNSRPCREREAGYIQALTDNGLPISSDHMISLGWRQADGQRAMTQLLETQPAPTAIFAASDLLALGACDAAHAARIQIPEELSIMGFDDIDMAAQAKPALSTILVRKMEMGQLAARLILEQLSGKRNYPIKVVVPTQIIERNSTGCMKTLATANR
ncbi:MAG: GntR family transcriptional regulator [Firmicutes bacterium]|nr:GntR family transcriptional regulator [Bacillota bacterium]